MYVNAYLMDFIFYFLLFVLPMQARLGRRYEGRERCSTAGGRGVGSGLLTLVDAVIKYIYW